MRRRGRRSARTDLIRSNIASSADRSTIGCGWNELAHAQLELDLGARSARGRSRSAVGKIAFGFVRARGAGYGSARSADHGEFEFPGGVGISHQLQLAEVGIPDPHEFENGPAHRYHPGQD